MPCSYACLYPPHITLLHCISDQQRSWSGPSAPAALLHRPPCGCNQTTALLETPSPSLPLSRARSHEDPATHTRAEPRTYSFRPAETLHGGAPALYVCTRMSSTLASARLFFVSARTFFIFPQHLETTRLRLFFVGTKRRRIAAS